MLGDVSYVPLGAFVELKGGKLNDTVQLGAEGYMDTFIYGESSHFAFLMVCMSTQGANPVRAESNALGSLAIDFFELFDAIHSRKSIIKKGGCVAAAFMIEGELFLLDDNGT